MLFIVDTKLPVAYEQKIPRFGVMLFMIDAKRHTRTFDARYVLE